MHHRAICRTVLLAICAFVLAQAESPKKTATLDKAEFEKFVRHLFIWGPQIQIKIEDPKESALPGFSEVNVVGSNGQATQAEKFLVSPDGRHVVRGTTYDTTKHPFEADAKRIKTADYASLGPENAPVTLVIYSDFQCSFCKEEARILRQEVVPAFRDQLRLVFKDYPLEPIHPWAKPAAIAAQCVFQQQPAAFWDYHDWVFENQAQITVENLKEKSLVFGKGRFWDTAKLSACIDAKATETAVNAAMSEANSIGVSSTPTMFVNGRKLVGQLGLPQLKSVIEQEIEFAKSRNAACCETKIALPVKAQ